MSRRVKNETLNYVNCLLIKILLRNIQINNKYLQILLKVKNNELALLLQTVVYSA